MRQMLFIAAVIISISVSCNSLKKTTGDPGHLTKREINNGWTLLFDGKTTRGWHKYGGGPVGEAWKITDGVLYLDTSKKYDKDPSEKMEMKIVGGGDIVTDDEYENFHLKLEWKISPKGNSGIMFYVNEDTAKYKEPYMTGPEMQILDDDGHPDGKFQNHRTGDLYDLVSASIKWIKPVGGWNLAEIKSLNGKLNLYLNGQWVVSITLWDDNWNTMVANSKFKEWPGFGTFKKGRICLQDHDNEVCYRNIKIRRL